MKDYNSADYIHRNDTDPVYKHNDDGSLVWNGKHPEIIGEKPNVYFWLEHQCDEWEIGGLDEAKRFLARLQELIDEVDNEAN